MANWTINRPHAHCHVAEIRVAEYLKDLDDRWTVIWGYFYRDDHGHDREGDFLVLGPAGGLLVLEVKSSIPRWFSSTGQWEGESGSRLFDLEMAPGDQGPGKASFRLKRESRTNPNVHHRHISGAEGQGAS